MNATPLLALKILSGSTAGRVFKLGENAFVGSETHCEIQLTDPGISPMHVRISLRGSAYTLVDLTDAPSVRVNGHVIKSRRLSLHDKMTIADVAMEMVDLSEMASPPPPAEAEIVVTSTEHVSKTAEIDELAAERWSEPAEETPRAERTRANAVSSRPQYYRPEAAIQERKSSASQVMRAIVVAVIVIIVVVGSGLLWATRKAEDRRLQATYQWAVEFAQAHPDDVAGVLKTYAEAQRRCAGVRPDMERFFAGEIRKLEERQAAKDREFEATLQSLDKKVKELVNALSFEEAVKVYEVDDARLRARVAEARKDVISSLKRRVAQLTTEQKEQQQKKEVEQKAQDGRQFKAELDKMLSGVVEAVIGGRCDNALETLDQMKAKEKYAALKEKIDEAETSVKLLRSTDATLLMAVKVTGGAENQQAVGVVPDASSAALLDTLSPLIRAVYQIRAANPVAALGELKKVEEHLLKDGLMARVQPSEEQLKAEAEALRKITSIWAKVVNDPAAPLPTPADGVAQLTKAAKEGNREQVLKACADFLQLRRDYGKTKVVKDYEPLFEAVDEVPGIPQVKISKLSGLGDGRVIQIEGDTYYAEANGDLSDAKDSSIGLCKEETVYYAADTNKVIGAWVDLYSILPFRVLGEKQLVFSLMAGQKQQTPAIGDCVLVGRDLQTGRKFLAGIARNQTTVAFSTDFERNLGEQWRSPPAAMTIENGKLALDVGAVEQKPKPGEGDLELNLELGTGPIGVEFDVIRKPDSALRVIMGDLEFLMGDHEGRAGGIYVGGKLVKPATFPRPVLGVAQHVTITKSRTFAGIEVSKSGVECRLSPNAGESDVRKIVFFNSTKMLLDNVKVNKLEGTGEAKVVGMSSDRKEVVVASGYETEWEVMAPGRSVYFFSGRPNETNVIAEAKVKDVVESWLICSTVKGQILGAGNLVAPSPEYPATPTGEQVMPELVKPRKQSPDTLYALAKPDTPGTVSLEVPGYVPEKGYLYPVTERLVSPQTAEVLAVVPGDPVKCEFKQEGGWIACSAVEGSILPDTPSNGVLISKGIVPSNRRIDLPAYSFSYTPGAQGTKKTFWKETSGEWKEKAGRTIGSPTILSEGPAVVTMSEAMGDGVQCDLDVRIEKEGKQSEDEWIKDLMIELYFPARQVGVTLGIGAGLNGGGISVLGHTISQDKGKQALSWSGALPASVDARIDGEWGKEAPSLKIGQSYMFRVRRVKDVLTFYINGKRLARVRHPQLDGDMQLRIAGAEAAISIGKVSGQELPRSYRTPDEEPALGEFGYVALADGTQVIADADMNGAAPGRKVSIMAIDKVVKGEKSKSVFLKRVATGTIVEVGARTAKISCVEEGTPITKGMKILPGSLPASVTVTDARILDLDQGL